MKIVVIGGTGLVGAKLVQQIAMAGHEAVVAARSTGVDTVTGEGLTPLLQGADVVVDASSPGYFDADAMQRFFEVSGTNLLRAEEQAGIAHHVVLSAVGAGRVQSGYFQAKCVQEDMVAASALPFTIVRSTPIYDYIYAIVDEGGDGDVLHVPPIRVQPISADDVARALLRVSLARPANAIIEVAGPDSWQLPDLAAQILTANEDMRSIRVDENALYFGAHVGDEPLTGGDHPRSAPTSFGDWLRHALVPVRSPSFTQDERQTI